MKELITRIAKALVDNPDQVLVSEIEGNPPPSSQPLRPRLGSEIRWTGWNLPR